MKKPNLVSDDQFSVLLEQFNDVKKSLDIAHGYREYDASKTDDLKNEMQEVRIRLGANEAQIDELRKLVDELGKAIKNIPAQTQKRVENAMEPTKTEIQGLQNIIGDKEVIAINVDKAKKANGWWYHLSRRLSK